MFSKSAALQNISIALINFTLAPGRPLSLRLEDRDARQAPSGEIPLFCGVRSILDVRFVSEKIATHIADKSAGPLDSIFS